MVLIFGGYLSEISVSKAKVYSESTLVILFIFHLSFSYMNWSIDLNWVIFGPHKGNTFLEHFPPGNAFLVVSCWLTSCAAYHSFIHFMKTL